MSKQFIEVNQQFSNDQVAISTGHNDKRLLLASIYMPCDSSEHPEEEVEHFLDYCSNKEYESVTGCDANSYNEARGSTDNNDRGEELLKFIIAKDLQICNVPRYRTNLQKCRERRSNRCYTL